MIERVPTEPFPSAEVLEAIGRAAEEPDIDKAIELEFEATERIRAMSDFPSPDDNPCPSKSTRRA